MAERDLRASRRYATALFESCRKQAKLPVLEADLDFVVGLLQSTPAFRRMWESPLVPASRKRDLVEKICASSVDTTTLAFLRLLIDKRREIILETVRLEVRRLADRSLHLIRAEAIFATPPTEEEKSALVKSLQERTGDSIDLTVTIDESILGGIIVRMSDTILDGSVRGTLEKLRIQLLQEA
jgi:F-type H+-transporting ATPase subunit delta